jgi:hypothetical protein
MVGYTKIDRKLFPDSNYPEIAVVIVQPGGSAKTLAANVAVPVEEELYTLDDIRRVYSTTIDEVSVIHAEFEYSKDLDLAASDVTNALNTIRSSLPKNIKEPQVHKISSATAPVVVIAVSPKDTQNIDLESVQKKIDEMGELKSVVLYDSFKETVFGKMNILVVPVRSINNYWGYIALVEKEQGIFTAADRKIMESVSQQISSALDRIAFMQDEIERQRMKEHISTNITIFWLLVLTF